jgi:hypothetical protein
MGWILPAIGVGSAIYGAFKGRGGPKQPKVDPRLRKFDEYAAGVGARGSQAENEFLAQARSFDPMAAATQASQAQYNLALPQIQRSVAALRGAQASSGRLRTGYGNQDQDQLLTDNFNNLNQSMIARAMEAAQMQMANTNMLGGYASDARNTYMDATLGRTMSDRDREAAERASKRGMWGSLGGAVLGGLGSWAGGGFKKPW